jgi:hypothetical protein
MKTQWEPMEASNDLSQIEKFTYSELSEAARQALPENSGGAAKLVAARAILPLVSADLIGVLFYLTFDRDPRIVETAKQSLAQLPDNIAVPVLRDRRTSPKILGHFGIELADRGSVVEAVALNSATPDPVFAHMARVCKDERLIDVFANNQTRLLRHPQIIQSLAENPITPTSTNDRIAQFYLIQTGQDYRETIRGEEPVSETAQEEPGETEAAAERQEVPTAADVLDDDLPPDFTIDDLLKEDFDFDEQFASDFLVDPELELTADKRESMENRVRKMGVVDKMRLGLKGNIEARNILIKNPNKLIQECVIRNPQISLDEVARIARNKSMREELIRMVASNREWVKNYVVKMNLIWNPKTPITLAMKWLPMVTVKDLERLAKSKQIPGMLAVSAKKALQNKNRYS